MASYGYLLPSRSIVLDAESPSQLSEKINHQIINTAHDAESAGFSGLWIGDSVTAKPRLDPLSTLASVAAVTDRVTLGTAVYLPALRHPIHVAHQTATLDQLSGGRFVFGVGVGGGPSVRREYEHFDVPFEKRGAILDEALEIVGRLWSGSTVDYRGDFFELEGARIGFPPRRPIPIYVASKQFDPTKGFPRRIRRRIVDVGDGWLPSAPFSQGISFSPEMYAAGLERVRTFATDAGRDPAEIDPGYYQDVIVADTEADAITEARAYLARYYPDVNDLSDEQIRQRGAFGSPDDVYQQFAAYRKRGVNTFVVRFPSERQHEQLHEFSKIIDHLE